MSADPLHSEKEILLRIAKGDETAFARFFDKYGPKVLHVASLFTHSPAQSKDILQDVFMRVWLKREQLPDIQNIENWLFIISRNLSVNALAKNARAAVLKTEVLDYMPLLETGIESKIEAAQLEVLIREALQLLTGQQQKVFEMIRLQGLNREETAQVLGLSANTVKFHLTRSNRVVRAYLAGKIDYLTLFGLLFFF